MPKKTNTSWGGVSDWYNDVLKDDDSYQKNVILPNLIRLLNVTRGENILDLACGQGYFSAEIAGRGARVIGCDISPELIKIAQSKPAKNLEYKICSAEDLGIFSDKTMDKIVVVLAIQNIENVNAVFRECRRVLKRGGEFHLVLNHPSYRIPGGSEWGWDAEKGIQYRRIDKYLSEDKVKILIHPGSDPTSFTVSFHRPLQYYFKLLGKNGFGVVGMEEWISHRLTASGPRKEAENISRKEIPLFMYIKALSL